MLGAGRGLRPQHIMGHCSSYLHAKIQLSKWYGLRDISKCHDWDGRLYNSSYQITMHTEWMPVVERTNNLNQIILILLILINILQSCCPRPSLKIATNDFQLGSWRDGFTSHDCMKYQQHNYLGDSTRCTAHRWEHIPLSQMVKAVGWRNKTAGDKN